MQEYNTIQRQIDDLTGTDAAQRHAEQRKFAVDQYHKYHTENRAQRRERERRERRAAKKVPA